MIGGALLSQGGYGCVFHPEINCQGKETQNKKIISKIQKDDFSAKNEIHISDLITKVTKTAEEKSLFAPVLSYCPINVSTIRTVGIEECAIITPQRISPFLLMKIRYIPGGVLDNFISSNQGSSLILSLFVSIYTYLLKSIHFLIRHQIIHFDLKGQNIIYNKDTGKPVIIDFGLSISLKELLKTREFFHYFYIFAPEYYVWPLEVHYFNFLENVSSAPTLGDIKKMSAEFVQKNPVIQQLSPSFRQNYEKACVRALEPYLQQSKEEAQNTILSDWKTWDNYSLSIMYLKYLLILFGSDALMEKNQYIIFLAQILLINIHPDPSRRSSVEKTLHIIERFPYNTEIDQISVFTELIDTITRNKGKIDKSVAGNNKEMTRLTKTILGIRERIS